MECHCARMFFLSYITLVCLVVSLSAVVDGRSTTFFNTAESHLRKKPAPKKTIETRHGDIYDCVDINKQPAFDHPLLRDHKIQMNPSFFSRLNVQNATIPSTITIGLIVDECPEGTVPIQRVTKEELVIAESNFKEQFRNFNSTQTDGEQPMLMYAGYSTKAGSGTHYAAGGAVSVNNPKATPGQLSGSVLSIEGGLPEQFSTIRVGWIVNINQFGDSHTRLYSVWGQATNGAMQGCYNLDCPGFVQVDKSITLGMVFDSVSVPGGTQYFVKLQIQLDKASGNWWLIYAESKNIGYWPSSLFTNLKYGASILRWGGQVASSSPQLPPMGNGNANESGSVYREIAFDDKSSTNMDDPAVALLEKLETGCYKVGDIYEKGDYHGYRFWFGGGGGDAQQCS